MKYLLDTVYTQQSRAATRVLNCLLTVPEVASLDISHARGYGKREINNFILIAAASTPATTTPTTTSTTTCKFVKKIYHNIYIFFWGSFFPVICSVQ